MSAYVEMIYMNMLPKNVFASIETTSYSIEMSNYLFHFRIC